MSVLGLGFTTTCLEPPKELKNDNPDITPNKEEYFDFFGVLKVVLGGLKVNLWVYKGIILPQTGKGATRAQQDSYKLKIQKSGGKPGGRGNDGGGGGGGLDTCT